MAPQRAALVWVTISIAALLCGMAWAQKLPDGPSIPMEYCSTVNTADMVPLNYNWQSDGRCYTNCTDLKYALAIVQAKNCWCSNLIPNSADQKPLSDCQAPCPGYPSDYCGGDGVFGYMEVGGFLPSGTAPAGGSATSPPMTSSTVQPPVTVTVPEELSSAPSSSSSSSSSTSTTNGGSSSKPPTMTTITVGGTVRTVTATAEPTDPSAGKVVESASTGLQTGAIVGIVVGVLGGLAVIAALIWLWYAKRRKQAEQGNTGIGSPTRGGSSPGTLGTPMTGEVSENRFAAGMAGSATSGWDSQNKRRSHLMPVDPRLDPFATGIYPGDQNRSRESFNSLQDNQDYSRRVHHPSRVLRATNPDPDVD